MTSVPAWIAPGMPHVAEQLPCGKIVKVIGASIPPGQTRRVIGSPQFDATPRVRGTFAWGYEILGVRVE